MLSQQEKNKTRRSFHIIQDPKTDKNGQTLFWTVISVICLILYFYISDEDSLGGSENHYAVIKAPTVEDREQAFQIDPSFIYLDKYCKGGQSGLKCQQEQMAALQSLIKMMAQDRDQGTNQVLHNIQASKMIQDYDFDGAGSENLHEFYLEAVLNSKLTTPKTRQRTFFNSFSSFFVPEDPYEGLASIFQNSQQQWEIEAEYPVLTVKSNRDIVPHYIELHSASGKRERVFIVGLMLTLQRELFAFKLGKYCLEPGTNLIECRSENCQRDFSMILLKFSRMKLKRVKIYQKISS